MLQWVNKAAAFCNKTKTDTFSNFGKQPSLFVIGRESSIQIRRCTLSVSNLLNIPEISAVLIYMKLIELRIWNYGIVKK